jgi:two-component system sensor histidine kinase/response regulator
MHIQRSDETLQHVAQALAAGISADRARVLVVEHEPDQQWRTARTLTLEGHRVIGTSSVDGALSLLAHCEMDLVLVAESLPGINGWNLADLIREAQPNVPTVVLTDGAEPRRGYAGTRREVLQAISKPFRVEKLTAMLESMAHGAPENDTQ